MGYSHIGRILFVQSAAAFTTWPPIGWNNYKQKGQCLLLVARTQWKMEASYWLLFKKVIRWSILFWQDSF